MSFGLEYCGSHVCAYVAVCQCMILCLRGHLQCLRKAGKGEGGEKAALCTSLCVCFWVFVWRTSQPNRGAGRQAALRQGGRGVKQIKHKPTNHRRWLISAVLKGEPGMSDDSPLWISQWRRAVCHHEYSRSQRRQSREAKVQTETPLALL